MEKLDYKKAIQILYGITFLIKMSKMRAHNIDGYFDYIAPPLEKSWWMNGIQGIDFTDKNGNHRKTECLYRTTGLSA